MATCQAIVVTATFVCVRLFKIRSMLAGPRTPAIWIPCHFPMLAALHDAFSNTQLNGRTPLVHSLISLCYVTAFDSHLQFELLTQRNSDG